MRMYVCAGLCALLAGVSPVLAASITNPSFETGDFTGWQSIGVAAVGSFSPSDGAFNAMISNNKGLGSVPYSSLNAFMGGPGLGPPPPNEEVGSGIKTTVIASAGDILLFDWQFATNEWQTIGGPYSDYTFYMLDGKMTTIYQIHTLTTPAGVFDPQTTAISLKPGTHTLGFGVMQYGDNVGTTQLSIDNLRIVNGNPVPLPSAAWASLPVLGLVGFMARRRRN